MDSTDGSQVESCGRCAMTSVVETTTDEDSERADRVFDGERIELEDTELRTASLPAVVAGRVKHRLDDLVMGFVYGR